MATALLVIDCQRFFASPLARALANILRLINAVSTTSRRALAVFTQHGHTADELSGKVANQLVKRWGVSGSIYRGSTEWELLPEIASLVTAATPVVSKNSYDAFINTGLEELLREREVQRVLVCGCLTDFCCETTAKSAFCRGFETWFVEDASGTEGGRAHEAAVKAFEKLCCRAKRTEDVVKWLEGGAEGE